MVELKEFLEQVLGCSVDVVTPDGLRAWMREEVEREAVRVV
jgi:predicted nucleotidyltransferase